jgi:Uncharacterized conserved protein
MNDTYLTIDTLSTGIYKAKGSKFLSFAVPINSVDEAKELIKIYKKEYADATHVCSAYKVGYENAEWKVNDDGEPSGTAGKPIFGQINSFQLTNVIILVIRYFGGILLGAGGLIVAYKNAAAEALNNAEIVEKIVEDTLTLQFDYALINEAMRVVKDVDANVLNQNYNYSKCILTVSIRKSKYDFLKQKIEEIYGVEVVL